MSDTLVFDRNMFVNRGMVSNSAVPIEDGGGVTGKEEPLETLPPDGTDTNSATIGSCGTMKDSVHAVALMVNDVMPTHAPFLNMYGETLPAGYEQLYCIVTFWTTFAEEVTLRLYATTADKPEGAEGATAVMFCMSTLALVRAGVFEVSFTMTCLPTLTVTGAVLDMFIVLEKVLGCVLSTKYDAMKFFDIAFATPLKYETFSSTVYVPATGVNDPDWKDRLPGAPIAVERVLLKNGPVILVFITMLDGER